MMPPPPGVIHQQVGRGAGVISKLTMVVVDMRSAPTALYLNSLQTRDGSPQGAFALKTSRTEQFQNLVDNTNFDPVRRALGGGASSGLGRSLFLARSSCLDTTQHNAPYQENPIRT